ncbi:pseudouridine synthase [Corynebacterium felinum]|uniref:RNA pseudouridylate synthase n=1 Tax=Corynebacterium felinum TaxID=131318 RepID=A0ABU2B6A0_9CORY|nr:pseudouridine synthase [Corynebacterium felinum]MDF5820562.1 pseudouridine synthase [Corynebacterium felinum]MDR7354142.1 tRNA pseudouridine32 synthase/23S rRNA pseudouridine746 synthase [Corynebacterium felinum]WJY96314.1 Ribosomal large subunit pseudouridine synthase A [Corynebacterium felinum]
MQENPARTKRPRRRPPLPVREGLNPTRARVPEEYAGVSAFDFVWMLKTTQRHQHPDDTQEELLEAFRRGEVRRNFFPEDQPLSPQEVLQAGTDVWFYRMPAVEVEVPYRCELIFEDEHLYVVDKPPYLATMPRGKHITQTATVQLRRLTGNNDLAPAHRLDRLTSGVLVFTKHAAARGPYQELFAQRLAQKTYVAVAARSNVAAGTVWEHRMEKVAGQVQGEIVPGEVNAITRVESVTECDASMMAQLRRMHGDIPDQAVYELKPLTGRTHQLRIHMWAAGVPILGDPAYPVVLPENYEDFSTPMHLISRELRFTDPLSGQQRVFCSSRDLSLSTSWAVS